LRWRNHLTLAVAGTVTTKAVARYSLVLALETDGAQEAPRLDARGGFLTARNTPPAWRQGRRQSGDGRSPRGPRLGARDRFLEAKGWSVVRFAAGDKLGGKRGMKRRRDGSAMAKDGGRRRRDLVCDWCVRLLAQGRRPRSCDSFSVFFR